MKRFSVPLQRRENLQETFSSEEDVLVLPQRSDRISHVERVRLKPHNSKDEFAVYVHGWSFGKEPSKPNLWFKAPLTKLGRVSPGTPILLRVDPRRPQLCFTKGDEGYLHAVKTHTRSGREGLVSVDAFCGEYLSDAPADRVQRGQVPTCPECLLEEWVDFTVGTYEMPDKVRKIQDKEAAERKYRANLPTRFDRIDDEDESEPELVFVVDEDPPDPEEPEGRDAKLHARVRHSKRVKDAKRARL